MSPPFPFAFWGPAAVVTSLNYTVGDPGGAGQTIVISGKHFTGAFSVTFGGTSATFVVSSDNAINVTLPAHAAGVVDVVVKTPFGPSTGGTGIFEYFSPAQLTVNGWWRANYTAPGANPRWSGTASAGTSGSNPLNLDTALPTTGTTVGGFTPAHFVSASTDSLVTSVATSSLATVGAGTIIALAQMNTLAAAGSPASSDPCLLSDNTNRLYNMGASSSGFRFSLTDSGGLKSTGFVSIPAQYNAFIGSWDSSHINAQVNGSSATPVVAAALTSAADTMLVGKTSGVGFSDFDMLEAIVAPSLLSATNINKIRGYFNQRYGVST
jgi:hypothetical protein